MPIAAEIFRAYDVRGIVGDDLTDEAAELLGRAFGTKVRAESGRRVLVGRDGRLSSPALAEVLIAGLRGSGCDVVEAGMVPTPGLLLRAPSFGDGWWRAGDREPQSTRVQRLQALPRHAHDLR